MSLENDVVFIQRMMKLYEAEPVFKAAGAKEVAKRPKPVLKKYRVNVDWSVDVSAADEYEAEELASDLFRIEDLGFEATELPPDTQINQIRRVG